MLSNAVFTLIVCFAAGVVWLQHRQVAALRTALAQRDDLLADSYARENVANARAAALRRALDAAHEAQAEQAEHDACARRRPAVARDDYQLAFPGANGDQATAQLVRHLRSTDLWLRVPLFATVLSTHGRH